MFSRLLDWLKSWRREKYDEFRPRERAIYGYSDGKQVVYVDPMVISKRVAEVFVDLSTAMKVAGSIHSDALKMDDKALQLIRGIFNVKAYEDGGLLQDETYDLLLHFWAFEDKVKKNSKTTVTSAPATSADTPPTSAASQPTSNGTGSGSAVAAPSIEQPQSSPSEPPSPSACVTQDSNTSGT